jgi:hypothetical protein
MFLELKLHYNGEPVLVQVREIVEVTPHPQGAFISTTAPAPPDTVPGMLVSNRYSDIVGAIRGAGAVIVRV